MGAKVIGCSEQSRSIQGQKVFFKEKTIFTEAEMAIAMEGYNELAKLAQKKA